MCVIIKFITARQLNRKYVFFCARKEKTAYNQGLDSVSVLLEDWLNEINWYIMCPCLSICNIVNAIDHTVDGVICNRKNRLIKNANFLWTWKPKHYTCLYIYICTYMNADMYMLSLMMFNIPFLFNNLFGQSWQICRKFRETLFCLIPRMNLTTFYVEWMAKDNEWKCCKLVKLNCQISPVYCVQKLLPLLPEVDQKYKVSGFCMIDVHCNFLIS